MASTTFFFQETWMRETPSCRQKKMIYYSCTFVESRYPQYNFVRVEPTQNANPCIVAYAQCELCILHTHLGEFLGRGEYCFEIAYGDYVRHANTMPALTCEFVPYKGVDFVNIQYNLAHESRALSQSILKLSQRLVFDTIVVADARGFLLCGEFMRENYRIVMARKPNKLPLPVSSITYDKEYGTDELSIETDVIPPNSRVVIIDDIAATGGTLLALDELVSSVFQSTCVAHIVAFAIEVEQGIPMCKSSKLRYARSQLKWSYPEWKEQDSKHTSMIAIVPPSLQVFAHTGPRANVKWNRYRDSSSLAMECQQFESKDVVFYMNTRNQCEMYDCLSLLKILYRKHPKSLKIVIPFMEHGTQDRIEYDGNMESIAQIDTIAKLIGKHHCETYDLHALQSQVVFHDLTNKSIVQVLFIGFMNQYPDAIAVFPDDGACKRYSYLCPKTHLVFRKQRVGDKRIVTTDDEIDHEAHYVIIDDMVRSGSTMTAVAKVLGAKQMSALFAHAPLEPKCRLDIFQDSIWTSNSCPDRVPPQWVRYRF